MARPARAIKTQSSNNTKKDIAIREEVEGKLKGATDKINAPKHLNREQKRYFKHIVDELTASGILGNLDVYVLAMCAISIERIKDIEERINKEPQLLYDAGLMSTKDKYAKDFFRCCNELCLSPQSRAKIGSMAAAAKKQPSKVLGIIGDDDE